MNYHYAFPPFRLKKVPEAFHLKKMFINSKIEEYKIGINMIRNKIDININFLLKLYFIFVKPIKAKIENINGSEV